MIHIPNTGFPPGTIITAAGTQPRYYEFSMSLEGLHVPAGTKCSIERSCDIAQNFNLGVRDMIGSWAWFLGDDHCFKADTLLRLLSHRVDVVVPITPCKIAPWMPCVMHGPDNPETDGVWHENMLLYDWDELSDPGLMAFPKGDFIGQAGMLVKKHVLDAIGYPWFKAGQLDAGRLQEDMTFCRDIQQHGFTVHVDRDIIFDHYFIIGVTARRLQGKYKPALVSGSSVMVLPDAKPAFDPNTPANKVPKDRRPMKWATLPSEADYIKKMEALNDPVTP